MSGNQPSAPPAASDTMDTQRFSDVGSSATRDPALFQALVKRSIKSWHSLNYVGWQDQVGDIAECTKILGSLTSLESLLQNGKFWFFQHRESFTQQTFMMKWNPDHLDAYVLFPRIDGFVNKQDCFFISHYWRTPQHPDPEGQDMRDFLHDLRQLEWSYIWVDWTCLPQPPRSEIQKAYFKRMLQFIPILIRECAMEWRFPAFEPRAWVLFETAEYLLTHLGPLTVTEDIVPFFSHTVEMSNEGVRAVISKYGYVCTNSSDLTLIIGWLELLIILTRVIPNVSTRRDILDWIDKEEVGSYTLFDEGRIEVDKSKGIISCNGTKFEFTPIFNLRDPV